jgi:hypothetical protein
MMQGEQRPTPSRCWAKAAANARQDEHRPPLRLVRMFEMFEKWLDCCSLYGMRSVPMNTAEAILQAALKVPEKDDLREHLGTISTLRGKGYSWRDIAAFLVSNGVDVDHARVYRAYTKHLAAVTKVPSAEQYVEGLRSIKMTDKARAMLQCHYLAPNRTVTYTELAKAAGQDEYRVANKVYGDLGFALGTKIGFEFPMAPKRGTPFYSGALGVDAPRDANNEYRLMMHHELAKAIAALKLFD